MTEAETASNLVGDIYDAALDPAMWVGVLAKIAGFAGARAGGLAVKDCASAGVESAARVATSRVTLRNIVGLS